MTESAEPGRADSFFVSSYRRLLADKDEALRRAVGVAQQQHLDLVDDLPSYLGHFFQYASVEDLAGADPIDLIGMAMSSRVTAQVREPGTTTVRVFNPTVDEHGWSGGHTVIVVISDDMPFLVDSLLGALGRQGRAIHGIQHPQFAVRRDDRGQLLGLRPFQSGQVLAGDEVDESWIHVEIDRDSDAASRERLQESLAGVLSDVRKAVRDWPLMREAAEDAAAEVAATTFAGMSDRERDEAVAFLKWLESGNFTFLGYREYRLVGEDGQESLELLPDTGLGILRNDDFHAGVRGALPEPARIRARDPEPLIITKANSHSTVHRSTYLDYIGVKVFDQRGKVIGERRFLGLFTAAAYAESVLRIPLLRHLVEQVRAIAGYPRDSHGDKDLVQLLETYPRDELFQMSADELGEIALAVLSLQERRRTRLFMRRDRFERFVSCLIYLPRDRYTTKVRRRLEHLLREAFHADSIEFTASVTESVLARLHFVVRVARSGELPHVDGEQLELEIADAARFWDDDFIDALAEAAGEELAADLQQHFAAGIPDGYKEWYSARTAVADVMRLAHLGSDDIDVNLYRPFVSDDRVRRLKIYRSGDPLSLSDILPMLQRMGLHVLDERPFEMGHSMSDPEVPVTIYDFGLRLDAAPGHGEGFKERFEAAFRAAFAGEIEADGFNALVVRGDLTHAEVVVHRAYARFLRQGGLPFSQAYVESGLAAHPGIARLLVDLFAARFDPAWVCADSADGSPPRRLACTADLTEQILAELDAVPVLDHDRILRAILDAMLATVRTNYYRRDRGPALSFKIRSARVPTLPKPLPMVEVWVYSPRVEGVHLRFGRVARGGLRWSDRPEDFRTEVLGLVKAQAVKNAVIVPAGAKGGFYPRLLPDPATDRAAWLAEGQAAYRTFISALLDVTDNRVEGRVEPPAEVVRYDDDDPYLVVAADKGTATFSDIANEIALRRGFWLGDAFASGGSNGYDHKKMGITARGAWESVKSHFKTLGMDTQSQDFTVIGIGDMSGDVFGNGMLLSPHIQLVAAFDHRHIFLDPNPDPRASFGERRRLFDLPRSSWADFRPEVISQGGGVHPRTAKSIPITDQVRRRLGLAAEVVALPPNQLIRAILTAPVDLFFNGGIGTYVKGSRETALDVGDRANDGIRINGSQLRCRVVGEGGNLGLTQLGRVEAARSGVLLNTDAIDNSAGVSTSDHEVNIKILVDEAVHDGEITERQRDELLHGMTDEIAEMVLTDNYLQNVHLTASGRLAGRSLSVQARLMRELEARDELDRSLEFLPDDDEIAERTALGEGLTSPERSVLMAYVKNVTTDALDDSSLPDDPYFMATLADYFPEVLREPFAEGMKRHALRRQIVVTCLVNDMVNRGGSTFPFRVAEELGAGPAETVRGFVFTRDVFRMQDLWRRIAALDHLVPAEVQEDMYLQLRRLLDRGTRWLIQTKGATLDLQHEVDYYAPIVQDLGSRIGELLRGSEAAELRADRALLEQQGVPEDVAHDVAGVLFRFQLLDIATVAARVSEEPPDVASLYFAISERFGVDRLLSGISTLPREGRWQTLARQSVRSDLYSAVASLTAEVLRETESTEDPDSRIDRWQSARSTEVHRAREILHEIDTLEQQDLATLSVALRAVRTLLTQSRAARG